MINDSKKLKVDFKFTPFDKGCALACLEMMARFLKLEINFNLLVKNVGVDEFGYDLFKIATWLVKNKIKIEIGFWDKLLFKKSEIDKKANLNSFLKEHQDVSIFYQKNTGVCKIEPPKISKIKKFINLGYPVIVHLSAKSLGASIEEEIHSVLVIGYNEKEIIILNPPKIGGEYVKNKDFLHFWQEGGGYYLVIKKPGVSN